RPDKDGIDVIETDVSNCMNIPVESVEMNFPLRISRARLWVDSGGAGRFRGGLGLEKVFEATTTDVMISHRGERFGSSPWGLEGGGPGARARAFIVRRDGAREELPSKKMIVLHPGDQLWEYIAGGGGYGDPLERDPAAVLADVLDGKLSAALGQERPQLARLDPERELLVGFRQRREEPLGADKRTRVREHVAMNVGKQQSAPGRRAGTPPQRGIDGRFGQVVRDALPEDER